MTGKTQYIFTNFIEMNSELFSNLCPDYILFFTKIQTKVGVDFLEKYGIKLTPAFVFPIYHFQIIIKMQRW